MRPLRILHVTPYFEEAWAYGGIPRIAGALASGLRARGHQITICTTDACRSDRRLPRPAGTSRLAPWRERTTSGVDVRVFPNVSNAAAYDLQCFLPVGLSAYLHAHARDFDVAHLHACHNLPGASAARHLARAGVPFVLAPNGTAPRIERRRLAKYLFDVSLGRNVTRRAARLVAVSDQERRDLAGLGIADDLIASVPNPIDLAEFDTPIARGTFRRARDLGDAPIVMFLGKLTPRKRLDVLARAFARLSHAGAHLVIAGNDMGSQRPLETLVRTLGIGDHVTTTGLLTGRDRLEALADADVVVYPSQDEIFGLVPLEALLSGTPVVVSGDSGCGEVIHRVGGGWVVPEGDVPALTAAIDAMLGAPARWRAAAEGAQATIRQLYGRDAVCAQLEAVYQDVIRS